MLDTLANPIFPIFAVLALGYGLQRSKLFDVPVAQAINKFVFFVAAPALVFSIISDAPIAEFDLRALGLYFAAQVCLYVVTAVVMRCILHRETGEALLLGMTAVFVNHVFFVLPIAERIYGTTAAQPIVGIILVDTGLVFPGTVLAVNLMQATNRSPLKIAGLLARNPFLIAAMLGVLAWAARPMIPQGVFTYATFAGGAAAPASLFALGIILAANPIRPFGMATWLVVAAKIVLHPALVFVLAGLVTLSPGWGNITFLAAAGPSGVMPFVIALQHNIKADTIAKAVLVSTLFSLLTLSLLTT